ALTKHTRRKRPGASTLRCPAAERSVLYPLCPLCVRFCMSVETSHAPSPAHRCLGLDRCERRCRPRPVQSSFRTRPLAVARLSSLGDELDEVHERLGRFLETAPRVEFELAVKLVAARKDVGARQAAERETRAIGAA